MKSLLTFIQEKKGDTSHTVFWHEVICGIACFYPQGAAGIFRGADIYPYFRDGTIKAYSASNSTIPIEDEKQFRFIDNAVDDDGNIVSPQATKKFWEANKGPAIKADAIALAAKLVARVGKPSPALGPVLWTGPTNSLSDYGAADIAYNGAGISLKYGEGQFKNLSANVVANKLLGTVNLMKDLHKDYADMWDYMTGQWCSVVVEALRTYPLGRFVKPDKKGEGGNDPVQNRLWRDEADELFKTLTKNHTLSWSEYQKLNLKEDEQQLFHDLLYKKGGKETTYDQNHKQGHMFKRLCPKIVAHSTSSLSVKGWMDQRNNIMADKIFARYFDDKKENIQNGLAALFEEQISVGAMPMWYASKGGKDIKLVPSKDQFDSKIDKIDLTYETKKVGAGYTFVLMAATKGQEPVDVMEIEIYFRWRNLQMYGNPDTSSKAIMHVDDYSEMFGD